MLLSGNIPADYPKPETNGTRLFYIQRNYNKNTVMYDANFDKSGTLDNTKPINVYWIRYEEGGRTMGLRAFEKRLAYGVKCNKSDGLANQFKVKLVAYDKREFLLKQEGAYKANLYGVISKKQAKLDCMYIFADNSGVLPDVKYVELFGTEVGTGKKVYEKVVNK
jgi:hypothetical protein